MRWLNQLQRKFGRYYIPDLMRTLIYIMGAVYLVGLFVPFQLYNALRLTRSGLISGEIWRLVTFLCLPPAGNIFTVLIQLYFYYMIGTALENEWGSFVFNVYYLIGALGCVIAALLTGSASNTFLNLSLFFAFAILFPEFEVLLFFFLPIKIKYIAILDALIYLIYFIFGSWSDRVCILLSLANVFLFFGKDGLNRIRTELGYLKTRRNFRRSVNRDRSRW